MTDTQLLDNLIKLRGMKVGFIVKQLGISWSAWYKKKNNIIPFRASEIFVICSLLNVSEEDKPKIFCAESSQ